MTLAQIACWALPPLVAARVRDAIYPQKLAYADDYEFVKRAKTGALYAGRTSDHLAYRFAVTGYYDWRVWAICKAVCAAGDSIVEIGANIGTESIAFADTVGSEGRVICFEPLPRNLEALRRMVELNQMKQVTTYPYAVADEEKELVFMPPTIVHNSGSGRIATAGEAVEDADAVTVRCIALDSIADSIERLRLMHVDVEGAEVSVLRGAARIIAREQPYLVLEASPKLLKRMGASLRALHDQCKAMGYSPYEIRRAGLRRVEVGELDTIHAANWLCVPDQEMDEVGRIGRVIGRAGVMPCVWGVNPIVG